MIATRSALASDELTTALRNLTARGERTHCSDPKSHHLWLSEDESEPLFIVPTERAGLDHRCCRSCEGGYDLIMLTRNLGPAVVLRILARKPFVHLSNLARAVALSLSGKDDACGYQ